MRLAFAVAALALLAACPPSRPPYPPIPAPPASPPVTIAQAMVDGVLPDTPETKLIRARCVVCHSEDYVVQQRLTPEQWAKTLAKMKKFGAKVDDAEAAQLASWLSSLYAPDLPDRGDKIVDKAGEAVPDWRVHAADAAAARSAH
jgi:hypothetical protein